VTTLNMKKALIVIAPKDFEDIEFLHTKEELEKAKINITITSNKKGTAVGTNGTKAQVDLGLDEVNVNDYDAIIFIGGIGACKYYRDKKALSLAIKAFNNGKKTCAICVAPLILANAGVLKNKNATVYKDLAQMLKEHGAIYTGKPVEVDGNIITANGPNSARLFGQTIARELKKIT
jgi:deglycase